MNFVTKFKIKLMARRYSKLLSKYIDTFVSVDAMKASVSELKNFFNAEKIESFVLKMNDFEDIESFQVMMMKYSHNLNLILTGVKLVIREFSYDKLDEVCTYFDLKEFFDSLDEVFNRENFETLLTTMNIKSDMYREYVRISIDIMEKELVDFKSSFDMDTEATEMTNREVALYVMDFYEIIIESSFRAIDQYLEGKDYNQVIDEMVSVAEDQIDFLEKNLIFEV